jgi:hypothetical protein
MNPDVAAAEEKSGRESHREGTNICVVHAEPPFSCEFRCKISIDK